MARPLPFLLAFPLLTAGLSCTSGPASDASRAEDPRAAESFEARVEIDPKPGYKAFQGVWLARDGGERLVLAYRPEPWLKSFEGQRVRATGERYVPEGQAIMAPHFRVHTLALVDTKDAMGIINVGPEQEIEGAFEDRVGAPGTKLEGEPYRVFQAEGGEAFLLVNTPEGAQPGKKTTIRARPVDLSPYVARRGGPYLWVLEVGSPRN